MAKKGMRRVNVSLPDRLADDLDYMAVRMGITRSALVGELLQEVSRLAEIMRDVPEDGVTPGDVLRARGRSLALIQERVAHVRNVLEVGDGS